MVDQLDFRGQRIARTALQRAGVDFSRADMYVMHGILYLRGVVKMLDDNSAEDAQVVASHVLRDLCKNASIQDYVCEVQVEKSV